MLLVQEVKLRHRKMSFPQDVGRLCVISSKFLAKNNKVPLNSCIVKKFVVN